MPKKLIRFVALLALIFSLFGSSGVAHAAPSPLSSHSLVPSSSPALQSLPAPSLNIGPLAPLGVQFVHVVTAANLGGPGSHVTIISNALIDGNPNAIILVTPNYNLSGLDGIYDNHPIGVYYSGGTWRIFNQDLAAMPIGAAFNVIIPTAGAGVFVQTATTSNITNNWTTIDNPLANGQPNAIVMATPVWNPGGTGGQYENHPIGVGYDGTRWTIFNQDIAAMPTNAAFNVYILTAQAGVFVHTAKPASIISNYTVIDNSLTNGNPNALLFVTPNYNPGSAGNIYEPHNIGVGYNGNNWTIFNQDVTAMPPDANFNVLVLVPTSANFIQTTTATNRVGDATMLDNPLTNGHPNALVFATANWNPFGSSGVYDNHNIGVYYLALLSQVGIFNQDSAIMPTNAAFNVFVPNPDASVFVHKATSANISGHTTVIDYPLTNNRPDALVFVTPNWNYGGVGGLNDDHPIGVYYSGGKWIIFNQDFATIPNGSTFNVFVRTPGIAAIVHTATAPNSSGDSTFIDNSLTNYNPNALLIVTQNWNPGGSGGTYNPHPIGVYYDGVEWGIFNQDLSAMPVGASFNVYVFGNRTLFLPLIKR